MGENKATKDAQTTREVALNEISKNAAETLLMTVGAGYEHLIVIWNNESQQCAATTTAGREDTVTQLLLAADVLLHVKGEFPDGANNRMDA